MMQYYQHLWRPQEDQDSMAQQQPTSSMLPVSANADVAAMDAATQQQKQAAAMLAAAAAQQAYYAQYVAAAGGQQQWAAAMGMTQMMDGAPLYAALPTTSDQAGHIATVVAAQQVHQEGIPREPDSKRKRRNNNNTNAK